MPAGPTRSLAGFASRAVTPAQPLTASDSAATSNAANEFPVRTFTLSVLSTAPAPGSTGFVTSSLGFEDGQPVGDFRLHRWLGRLVQNLSVQRHGASLVAFGG